MKIYDLTGPIRDGQDWFGPPVPPVRFREMGAIAKDGWVSHALEMTCLSGTYLETSAHLIEGRRSIDRIDAADLVMPACMVRVADCPDRHAITAEDLDGLSEHRPGEAVIVATGYDARYDTPRYFEDSPFFTQGAVERLLASDDVPLLGLDIMSFDDPQGPDAWRMPLLRKVFERDMLLLCPLVGLDAITETHVELAALPLKLEGLTASPCRAVATRRRVRSPDADQNRSVP